MKGPVITALEKEQMQKLEKYLLRMNNLEPAEAYSFIETLHGIQAKAVVLGNSFQPLTEEDKKGRRFMAECQKCGWKGSSALMLGGEPLADTGDFTDACCPICYVTDVDAVEEETAEELVEEAKRRLQIACPGEEFGENADLEVVWNILEELGRLPMNNARLEFLEREYKKLTEKNDDTLKH